MVVLPPLLCPTKAMMMSPSTEKLPSLKSVCQGWEKQEIIHPTVARHHHRAVSLPTTLPSNPPPFAAKKQDDRLSMEVLLKAIALDQEMTDVYKKERVKSFVREQQWLHKTQPTSSFKHHHQKELLRRRSRSAPGAPMAHYYHHIALNATRWYLPNHGDLHPSQRDSYDIAHAIVQQHLKSATNYRK
ncbi:uncharacterized protein BX664DRAFT_332490 [Halteromyces radiatus]|uniref:uncharacterized protein n=1 Tax=Halteromyces radiatus TaxID=101107 RepID=UPI00221E41B8|nr:uncharacterized protein BX664DRAFT_332490 [Halteromyces radiatus]KAI8089234.1 hypothetical protein BX664DRAFT_332490 [Halteromyces radiatus]